MSKMFKLSSSSAEAVASIEELLNLILLRVPALSLIRFQSVSKHWHSLISDPDFRRHHTLQNRNSKISAFFSPITNEEAFKSITLEIPSGNPFKTLNTSVPGASKLMIRILQSCNGLFLCQIWLIREPTKPIYVVNPTTNQFRGLSPPSVCQEKRDAFVRYALAFDPSRSPHYNVVCVTNYQRYYEKGQHKIYIFSSETGEWKHLETPFFRSPNEEGHQVFVESALNFDFRSKLEAVYYNGAVHWIRDRYVSSLSSCLHVDGKLEFMRSKSDVLHYFEISQERLLVVSATPPVSPVVNNIPQGINRFGRRTITWPTLIQIYFGECGGRLYYIETYKQCMFQFDLMEMESDYSGWFVKYHVDLNPLVAALPGPDWNFFTVLCLSPKEETSRRTSDEGKVISYNSTNGTFKTSVEFANKELFIDLKHCIRKDVTFPFRETLACL
ncbi:F-box protein At5g07610-like [Argentina anserina]|uniref:F-box protein At5g07610-like n=1 Tax=Argentina anserina TaxID=57926 RepID=UPI0021765E2F|nr:F-box protein At5g07610-like [Potentilla anserina]